MKKIIFIFCLAAFSSVLSQDKYLIYFKDKGTDSRQSLMKTADHEKLARKFLSKRSIERRKKIKGDNFLTIQDLPLEKMYLSKVREKGVKIINRLKWFNAVSAYLNEKQLNLLKREDFVDRIEKVKKVKSTEPVNKPLDVTASINKISSEHTYNYGNSLVQNELSDIPQVHDLGITGKGVVIGLLDSGYDWENHIALKDRDVIAERDFIFNDDETANEEDVDFKGQHNHGTSVFSILAGFDETNLIGPAFDSRFLLAKTEYVPTETHSEEDNYAAALEWMDSIGVDITSSSLGYSNGFEEYGEEDYTYEDMDGKSTIVTKAAEMAFDRGIIVITSAGNEGNTQWNYITAPGDGINTITVGAVTSTNFVASFSSVGPSYDGRLKPELVAMGVSVVNARAGNTDSYSIGNGTSYSAPITAGISGLLLSTHPHLTNSQVRRILMESGDNVAEPDNERGYGLVSALKAVTYPNLEKDGDSFILHKIFEDNAILDKHSVELNFGNDINFFMTQNGKVFNTILPVLDMYETYEFYFTYRDLEGNKYREPADRNYNFKYGELDINLMLDPSPQILDEKYKLFQNYPNPFNPITRIEYSLPDSHGESRVTIKLFNILGQEVKTLVNQIQQSGKYAVELSSAGLSSGVYFYTLEAKDFLQTRKLIILK